jgi:zinc transport system substrate-binding protein
VFFVNGLGLEDEADGIAGRLKRVSQNQNVVNLGARFKEDDLLEGECFHHHHDHGKGGHDDHEHGIDPHVWLSVKHARVMVEGIRDELKRLDPAHTAGYEERAANYLKKLDQLEADGRSLLANKEEKRILSFHEAFQYFGDCYGIQVVGAIQMDPGREPTSEKLDRLVEQCRKKRVRVIAVEPQYSNHTSARVIRDALRGLEKDPIDAVFVELDPLETCDEADLSPDLYEKVMRRNLADLARVLR